MPISPQSSIPVAKIIQLIPVYNMALNVAILLSTMLGPFLADLVGLREALIIVCILRVGSGLALACWG